MSFGIRVLSLVSVIALVVGCGGEPPLHPITGKITLGGKSYERLIVYLKPVEGAVTRYNLGVGETDAEGNLSLRSSAGMGMQAGKYRVTFSCYVVKGGQAIGIDQKADEIKGAETAVPKELVPEPYAEGCTQESPLIFEVVPGKESTLVFDIPAGQ